MKSIQLMIEKITVQFRNILSDTNESEFQMISLEPEWNITTIFGILLDYPAVYWYEDIIDGKTCLSGKDLINYKLLNTISTKASLIHNVVFSFTIPRNVITSLVERAIEVWISQRCMSGEINKLILTCEKKEVNFSTVLL